MIILCGPSASGKTEVAKYLFQNNKMKKVVTHTTRPIRINEKQDVDYHFVSKDDFLELKKTNIFVETVCYNGNFYGSSKKEIGNDKCVILDPKGSFLYKQLKDPRIVIFFLNCSEETRIKRMRNRLDKEEDIQARIKNDKNDFANQNDLADFLIDTEEKSIPEIAQEIYHLYTLKINTKSN